MTAFDIAKENYRMSPKWGDRDVDRQQEDVPCPTALQSRVT